MWVIGWVGLAYVSAFIGKLSPLINPWCTVFEWVESLYRRFGGGRDLSLRLWASYWHFVGAIWLVTWLTVFVL